MVLKKKTTFENKQVLRFLFSYLFFFIAFILHNKCNAQGANLPLGSSNYTAIERLQIKSGLKGNFQITSKPNIRADITAYALMLDTAIWLTTLDKDDIRRILLDNNEWVADGQYSKTIGERVKDTYFKVGQDSLGPIYRKTNQPYNDLCLASPNYTRCKKPILRYFYPTPANWFEINKPNFQLRVNPTLNFSVARPNTGEPLFFNQRGLEIRGGVDDRVYFSTNITETQARFPEYARTYIEKFKAIPGNGYYKPFESTTFNSKNSYDFLNAQGHIGLKLTPSIGLEFGHGKHFIGNGYRSLLLSDFSHNYLYLRVNWNIWRIHYQNLFTELTALSAQANPEDDYIPRKYMAAHYLGIDVSKNFTIGFYEATIFKRDTTNNEGFELQYLNPVILYRSVEHLLDSDDNIILGLDFKWDIFKRIRLYGQFVLDEFVLNEIKANKGYWANKYGYQAGFQYIDVGGVDHLDIRGEFNAVRPYTFTHTDLIGANYSHYNQALAHPLGANFRELLTIIRYRPSKKITIEGRYIHALSGQDNEGENWGSNILLDYNTIEREYGNEIGQGVRTITNLFGLDFSYEFWHNVNIDLSYFMRKVHTDLPATNITNSFFGLGIRWNTSKVRMDF